MEGMEAGHKKMMDLIGKKLDNLLRRKKHNELSDSSTEGSVASDGSAVEEINPTAHDEELDKRYQLGGDECRKGQPKLICPTFNGTDLISWLSRANQYFELNEIEREDKVRYAAYYLEGEANMWWQ
ncbi:hypothetical protein ACS0TY_022916 [Phlomoides rotata]